MEGAGSIVVSYRSDDSNWTLSVRDNGAGMAKGPTPAKTGLGTSIVEALAKQLGAKVTIASADPGTIISISHEAEQTGAGRLVDPN
jgi:two-component sensor histidine kinase